MIRITSRAFAVFLPTLGVLLGAQLAVPPLRAQIVSPGGTSSTSTCGPRIKKKDVLVLDLERFGTETEAMAAFIDEYVSDLEMQTDPPETIRTALRSARKNRRSAMLRVQKTSAERGCNVVLVFRAWAGPESASYLQTVPSLNGGTQGVAVGLHYAYATVKMGTGEH